jgi:hypothetical protein
MMVRLLRDAAEPQRLLEPRQRDGQTRPTEDERHAGYDEARSCGSAGERRVFDRARAVEPSRVRRLGQRPIGFELRNVRSLVVVAYGRGTPAPPACSCGRSRRR